MRAILYETFGGPLELRQLPDPAPPADGVVIRVEASGVCRSDWHGWRGHDADVRLPHVPGHELAGVIAAVGPAVRRWRGGERVTVPFAVGCGVCVECAAGHPQICDDYFQPGFTAWGSFAEYTAIPHADANLVRLPDELGFVEAASLGCRFVTSYRAVVAQGRVGPGQWVAVHGCGGVGLAAVMIAQACGAQVVAIDLKPAALERARALGAAHGVEARPEVDVPAAIRALTGGGAHVSLDALGSAVTCLNSVLCLRKRGRHVQVGLLPGEAREAALPMNVVLGRELELVGSHGMAAHAYPPMLELIRAGRLQPGRLVARRIALNEAPEALRALGTFRDEGITVIDRF